ncbi:MAG: hypothetical protein Q3X03_05930 [Eggerthellaceae bacterium]|nr:hypothetical protein [Eggerthellaceae bacterium]
MVNVEKRRRGKVGTNPSHRELAVAESQWLDGPKGTSELFCLNIFHSKRTIFGSVVGQ